MPGPLKNHRHELFCLALAEGKSACDAYLAAGYVWHDANCIRLKKHPKIQARLRELQEGLAKSTEITIASICRELDAANEVAHKNGQATALVSAATLKAKLAGLLTEKIKAEITVENPYEKAASADEACRMFAKDFADDIVLSPNELDHLAGMIKDAQLRMSQYVASCRARPINPSYSQRQIELSRKANGKLTTI
jgi:hypothetical protein